MKMTKQEFLAKYGHVKVRFLYYYKNTFTYAGKLDDETEITCYFGLTADDIYLHEVLADEFYLIKNLNPHEGVAYQDAEILHRFYDKGK